MKKTNHRAFQIGLLVLALVVLAGRAPANVSAYEGGAGQVFSSKGLTGITFDNSVDDADRAFLQTSLQFLSTHLPVWYVYLESAKPVMLSIDATRDASGTAAFADCCTQGVSKITFGYHFGTIAMPTQTNVQSLPARQIAFLGYLLHEATHIHDLRAGRIPRQMDSASCLVGEKAALAQELAFKRALTLTHRTDSTLDPYRLAAQTQVDAEAANLDDARYWERYCGCATEPKLSNGIDFAQ